MNVNMACSIPRRARPSRNRSSSALAQLHHFRMQDGEAVLLLRDHAVIGKYLRDDDGQEKRHAGKAGAAAPFFVSRGHHGVIMDRLEMTRHALRMPIARARLGS
jgi:hypothetical protein